MGTERFAGHNRGVEVEQYEPGKFRDRPLSKAELLAREPAEHIQDRIFEYANFAGVCYYPIFKLIAAAIQHGIDYALRWQEVILDELIARKLSKPEFLDSPKAALHELLEAVRRETREDPDRDQWMRIAVVVMSCAEKQNGLHLVPRDEEGLEAFFESIGCALEESMEDILHPEEDEPA